MPLQVTDIKNKASWAVVVHTCNPSTWEAEAGRSLGLVYRGSSRTARATQRHPVSEKKKKKKLKKEQSKFKYINKFGSLKVLARDNIKKTTNST